MNQCTHVLSSLVLGALVGACGAPTKAPPAAASVAAATPLAGPDGHATEPDIASSRSRGPAALEELLAVHDRMAPGAERERLAARIDAVAAQRYATYSRLYWYTDLTEARAAARDSGKPILSLRMLGDLSQDYSCANSRFFRVVLYANREVSDFLREHFVLHWSSERAVPSVTIDYGDGRVMRRTLAGNSAHYVLDQDGRPVDVLPGLYAPEAFLGELRLAHQLARETAGLAGDERAARIRAHHQRVMQRAADLSIPYRAVLLPGPRPAGAAGEAPSIMAAERTVVSKAAIEVPILATIGLGEAIEARRSDAALLERLAEQLEPAALDASSRALIAALAPSDWQVAPGTLTGAALARLIAGFERQLAVDTLFNQVGLRYQISERLVATPELPTFAALNRWIYDEVFLTPASDPWLGMGARDTFTALPADGLSPAR